MCRKTCVVYERVNVYSTDVSRINDCKERQMLPWLSSHAHMLILYCQRARAHTCAAQVQRGFRDPEESNAMYVSGTMLGE